MTAPTTNVLVTLDDVTTFPAHVDLARPALWNGFVRPTFTPDVANQVMRWCNTAPGDDGERLGWIGTLIVAVDPATNLATSYQPVNGRYALGAGAWMWELACLYCQTTVVAAEARGADEAIRPFCDRHCEDHYRATRRVPDVAEQLGVEVGLVEVVLADLLERHHSPGCLVLDPEEPVSPFTRVLYLGVAAIEAEFAPREGGQRVSYRVVFVNAVNGTHTHQEAADYAAAYALARDVNNHPFNNTTVRIEHGGQVVYESPTPEQRAADYRALMAHRRPRAVYHR